MNNDIAQFDLHFFMQKTLLNVFLLKTGSEPLFIHFCLKMNVLKKILINVVQGFKCLASLKSEFPKWLQK